MLPDAKDPDLEFALICNSIILGIIYDSEVRVHRILENTYIIESTSDDLDLVSVGLTVIGELYPEDVELSPLETVEVSAFRYATTVVVEL